MAAKTKLELTWIGKGSRPRLEPRILIEDERFSHHASSRRDGDVFDNLLVHADNLLGLKALEADFSGQVKCAFIDPPYNTGAAFKHYDDGLEHSVWLSMMRERIEAIHRLLSDDGSLWVVLDENELHYLKIVCDEIFGRSNFRRHITWQKKYSVSNNFKGIASICDHILVYAKTEKFRNNLLPRSQESQDRYSNPDNDPRGPWKAVDYLNQATPEQRPNLCYIIENPNTGEKIGNPRKAWKYEPQTHAVHVAENRLWWGINGSNSVPALKLFLSEVRDGMTPHNWWPHDEVGHTDEAKKESIAIFGSRDVFDTPKPERLVQRVLELSTAPGDLVLDSFAGSGTTGAVAHKMGRRWIMVELGDHCETHIVPRLNKVIDGKDSGGVTEAVGWKGGGGYRYFKLAPSLLEKDQFGNWVISKSYNAEMLAEAMCKHFSFAYVRDDKLREKLDAKLVSAIHAAIAAGTSDNIHLAAPAVFDPEEFGDVRYVGFRSKKDHHQIDFADYIAELKARGQVPDLKALTDTHWLAEVRDGSAAKRWKVYDCIVFEAEHEGAQYVLSGGKWYVVAKSLVDEVNAYFAGLQRRNLPAAKSGENEAEYNSRIDKEVDALACLDRELIRPTGATSDIEACDFFSDERQFIHVKDEAASSRLSHLFSQGLVSAMTFRTDKTFRTKLRAKLEGVSAPHGGLLPSADEEPDPKDYEVVFAVMRSPTSKGEMRLPFFSLVTLRQAARQITALGFRVAFAWVEKPPVAKTS